MPIYLMLMLAGSVLGRACGKAGRQGLSYYITIIIIFIIIIIIIKVCNRASVYVPLQMSVIL